MLCLQRLARLLPRSAGARSRALGLSEFGARGGEALLGLRELLLAGLEVERAAAPVALLDPGGDLDGAPGQPCAALIELRAPLAQAPLLFLLLPPPLFRVAELGFGRLQRTTCGFAALFGRLEHRRGVGFDSQRGSELGLGIPSGRRAVTERQLRLPEAEQLLGIGQRPLLSFGPGALFSELLHAGFGRGNRAHRLAQSGVGSLCDRVGGAGCRRDLLDFLAEPGNRGGERGAFVGEAAGVRLAVRARPHRMLEIAGDLGLPFLELAAAGIEPARLVIDHGAALAEARELGRELGRGRPQLRRRMRRPVTRGPRGVASRPASLVAPSRPSASAASAAASSIRARRQRPTSSAASVSR